MDDHERPERGPSPDEDDGVVPEHIVEAAYEAERETGRREETDAEARVTIRWRLVRMTAGFGLLVLGGLMLVLPGPGWLCIAAGLAILSRDVAWAERLLTRVRARLPADADGNVPKGLIVGSVALMVVGAAASVWFWLS